MKRYQSLILAAFAFSFVACEPEFENEVSNEIYSSGDADFTAYVAVGNSLTAGYMDGTVYRSGQQYSFPNLLSKQFALVGGGAFTQPSFGDDGSDVRSEERRVGKECRYGCSPDCHREIDTDVSLGR